MGFIIHCPHCRQPMTANDSMLGKASSCVRCKRPLRISRPGVAAKAPSADALAPLKAQQTQMPQGTPPQKKRRMHGCLLAFLIALALLVVGLPVGFYVAGQALMDYVSESVAKSPLYLAVAAGDIQEVDRLLAEGANPDEKAIMGHSPLIMAARSDYPLIAERLLNAGADPNQRDSLDWAPLHHAVKTDSASLDMIDILVRHGADVNVTDSHLRTPLHRAAQFGHVQAVQLLLCLGADPNAEDENGWTPLDRGRLHPAIVSILERVPRRTAREEPARLEGKYGADKKTESRQEDRTHTGTLDEIAQERRRWQQLGLVPFTSAEDGFSAWFPAKPEKGEYGIVTNYAAMVEGEAAYNVFVNEFPAPVLTDEAIDASLKGYLEGKVMMFGKAARVTRSETVAFLGRRALNYECIYEVQGVKVYTTGVAFHEGKWLYCISVVCPVAEAKGTAYTKYRAVRDSFRLTGAR